jgi:uncharacterized membrane protein YczE
MRRRLVQLYVSLALYGVSMALMIRSELGNMPWDVLHEGLAERLGLPFGVVVLIVSALVLMAWWPLRERPGLGTVSNVVVISAVIDPALAIVPDSSDLAARVALAVAGVVLNGAATAAYIGVHLGPGPRDGLMTGLVRTTGASVRLVRTAIEVAVVVTGFLLGGTLGAIAVLYALAIGPLAQLFLPLFSVPAAERARILCRLAKSSSRSPSSAPDSARNRRPARNAAASGVTPSSSAATSVRVTPSRISASMWSSASGGEASWATLV